MNRKAFFDTIRPLFGGSLKQTQVDGLSIILDEAEKRSTWRNNLAYVLGTTFHETNETMQPVREAYWLSEAWRKKHLRYWPWYGRGFVQLTWGDGYRNADNKLALKGALVADPDLAMKPEIAVQILFSGMEDGWFTRRKDSDFINAADESDAKDLREYIAARKVVNGADRAAKIGGYAIKFEHALTAADYPIK